MNRSDDTTILPPPAGGSGQGYSHGYPYASSTSGEKGLPGLGRLDLHRILRVARRKWLLIVAAMVLAGGAAGWYVHRLPSVYRALAMIELSVRRPRLVNQQSAVIEDPTLGYQVEETLNTKLEELRGGSELMAQAMAAYRRSRAEDKRTDQELARALCGRVDFTLLRRTRLVRVTFEHSDAHFAADGCNAYAEAAETIAREENRRASDAAVAWLQGQAEAQRKEIEKRDAEMLAFRQANHLNAMETERKSIDEGLVQINQTIVGVESRAAQDRELIETLKKLDLAPESYGALPASIPRAEDIRVAVEKWLAAKTLRDGMLTRYTSEHPEVVSQSRLVVMLHEQAAETIQRARTTAEADLNLLTRQAASLTKGRTEQQKRSDELELKIVEAKMKLDALERARAASDNSYRGLLTRIQEARLAADENTATVKIITPAGLPAIPQGAAASRILILALLSGLVVGLALGLVIDTMEDYVAGPDDFEEVTGLAALAVIPHVRERGRAEVARMTVVSGDGPLPESFAGLRNVLDSPQYKAKSRVVLLLSSLPAEGKTVAACNLAAAFARNGQRTLLIDFDLRRPRLAGIFPMPAGTPTMASALSTDDSVIAFDQLVYEGGIPNLFVAAGRAVRTGRAPVDLVAGSRASELVSWARARYDRIVLDAPPLGVVSDGLVLAGLADLVLVAVRVDASRKRTVAHTLRRLKGVGVAAIAAIVGDLDYSRRWARGAPYYYYQKAYAHYADPAEGGSAPDSKPDPNPASPPS